MLHGFGVDPKLARGTPAQHAFQGGFFELDNLQWLVRHLPVLDLSKLNDPNPWVGNPRLYTVNLLPDTSKQPSHC